MVSTCESACVLLVMFLVPPKSYEFSLGVLSVTAWQLLQVVM